MQGFEGVVLSLCAASAVWCLILVWMDGRD